MANTIVATKVTVTEAQLPLLEDAATEQGKPLEEFLGTALGNGQSVQGIANDRAQQAFWRVMQTGEIPAEILAESRRQAKANAPKLDPMAA